MCVWWRTSLVLLGGGPVRVRQTKRVPSGDHSKFDAPFSKFDTRRASPPLRDSSQICVRPPSRAERNARNRPSGDHRGEVEEVFSLVNGTGGCVPSTDAIQMRDTRRFAF